jgi:histidinol-phosphate phosphatase family protein
MISKIGDIDSTWTLFLDRDGVINRRIVDGYVLRKEDFVFLPGALDAIAGFSKLFKRIVVVTNQQGIAKGLMTEDNLLGIHTMMKEEISSAGGRIDGVYYCPELKGTPGGCRKPGVAMGLQAKREFPEIRFKRSIMVGDSPSDMVFARRLGMKRVFIDNGDGALSPGSAGCDLRFNALMPLLHYLVERI